MNKETLKKDAAAYIESHREELISHGRHLYSIPEPGYRETKTAAYAKQVLESCGLNVRDHVALTGLKAKAEGNAHDINVAVMGELDSLIMPSHAKASEGTGYFHGCGHHAQLTCVLGVAIGLIRSGIFRELDGDVTFIGAPAEETIEMEYRERLIAEGKVRYASGKQELLSLGELDDVDMILMSHIMGHTSEAKSWVGHSWNGIVHKTVRYTGKGAHAGLAPERGINALEGALCGMNAINAMRERFDDKDHVRVHYIITKGGDSPNIVPDDVRMEFGVRAATVEAMTQANDRVNAALRLGGESVGAGVEIRETGCYLPCHQCRELGDIYLRNAVDLLGAENVTDSFGEHRGSSTDCGDVASLKPLIHPYFGGAVGVPHGLDFDIVNDYAAYVVPAKIAAATVIDLLCDGAEKAKAIKRNFRPAFASTEEYLAYTGRLFG